MLALIAWTGSYLHMHLAPARRTARATGLVAAAPSRRTALDPTRDRAVVAGNRTVEVAELNITAARLGVHGNRYNDTHLSLVGR